MHKYFCCIGFKHKVARKVTIFFCMMDRKKNKKNSHEFRAIEKKNRRPASTSQKITNYHINQVLKEFTEIKITDSY